MYTYDNIGNTIDLTQYVKQEIPSIDAVQILENTYEDNSTYNSDNTMSDNSMYGGSIFKKLLNWRVGILVVLAVLIIIFLVKENLIKTSKSNYISKSSSRSGSSSSSSLSLSSRKSSKKN